MKSEAQRRKITNSLLHKVSVIMPLLLTVPGYITDIKKNISCHSVDITRLFEEHGGIDYIHTHT